MPRTKALSAKAKKAAGKPSPMGWHTVDRFRTCGHKGFLYDILGLRPRYLSKALPFGQAYHEGTSVFYKTGDSGEALKAASTTLDSLEEFYEFEDHFESDKERLELLLDAWIQTFGFDDLERYTLVETEMEHKVPLGDSGFFMTVRMDAVLQEKDNTKVLRVLEKKTTGWRLDATIQGVELDGQAPAYLVACKHLWPKKEAAVIPDVACWPSKSKNPKDIVCDRGRPLSLTEEELQVFVEETAQKISEISQGAEAYLKGQIPDHVPFQRVRNKGICLAYNHACEFAEICRLPLRGGEQIFGFYWDEQTLQRRWDLAKGRVSKRKGGKG